MGNKDLHAGLGWHSLNDSNIKVAFSGNKKYLFFFNGDEFLMSLTANDFQAINEKLNKERSYMRYTRHYLAKCKSVLGADFRAVISNKLYIEELNEKFATKLRGISSDTISAKKRKKLFNEAFREIDFRYYINMVDLRGA